MLSFINQCFLRHSIIIVGIAFSTTVSNLDNGDIIEISRTKCRLIIINTAYLQCVTLAKSLQKQSGQGREKP